MLEVKNVNVVKVAAMEEETEDDKTKIRRRNLPSLSFSRFMLTLQIYAFDSSDFLFLRSIR